MGLLRTLEQRATIESPSTPLTSANLAVRFGGEPTLAGVTINEHTALGIAAAFACVRVLAETVGSLPCHLYRRLERGKERATDHPLHRLLRVAPNPEIDASRFFSTLQGHVATWGNGYAEKELDQANRLVALWPLTPNRVTPKRENGRRFYEVQNPKGGPPTILPPERVFHVAGFGFDGLRGYSVVYLARKALGLAAATEEYGSRYFGQGARMQTTITHPTTLSDKAYGRLKEQLAQRHEGLSNSHRLQLLEEGMQVHQTSFAPDDSQFLQTRKFQVVEVARMFRMPLSKIQELDRAIHSNIEQQDIEFVRDTIRPQLVFWEAAIHTQLMARAEQSEIFAEFLLDGLLRGDTKTRHEAYTSGIQWGYLTRNDVREMENLNPIEGGDEALVPLNMIPASMLTKVQGSTEPDGSTDDEGDDEGDEPDGEDGGEPQRLAEGKAGADGAVEPELAAAPEDHAEALAEERARRSALGRHRLFSAFRKLLADAGARIVAGEVSAARRLLRKAAAANDGRIDELFLRELERFYAEQFPELVRRALLGPLLALARATFDSVAEETGADPGSDPEVDRAAGERASSYAAHHAAGSQGQLAAVIREAVEADEDPVAAVEARLTEWEERRAEKIGDRETVYSSGAFAVAAFALAGIVSLRWYAVGKTCPFCSRMNGRRTQTGQTFIPKGDTLDPQDGETAPLVIRRTIRHPPIHDGCDCVVVAG